MTHKKMTRRASDNVYLHKDFHGALSNAIEYLHQKYGAESVRNYLRQFTRNFYAPLAENLKEEGLVALRDHYERVYRREGGEIESTLESKKLTIEVKHSPAVQHMRDNGYQVAELFHETIRTVNETLCEGTPFVSDLENYDPDTGACTMLFERKES